MVKNKKIKMIILWIFLLVILAFDADAFGVSSPYWDENPLIVNPGDTKEFQMILQNMVGGEDITAEAKVNSGKDILSIADQNTIYKVPFGGNNIPVNLKVSVPENAKPGQEFQVGVSFKTVADNSGGVAIGTAVDKGFKVKIAEKPRVTSQSSKTNFNVQPLFGFIIGIAILIILFFILRRYHKL